MSSSAVHGSRYVTLLHLWVLGPVLITDGLISDPEPEAQRAGVAQPHPDVRSGGILGFLLDQYLVFKTGDGDQVMVVCSAVVQGILPGHALFDQDHCICRGRNSEDSSAVQLIDSFDYVYINVLIIFILKEVRCKILPVSVGEKKSREMLLVKLTLVAVEGF